MCFSLLWFCRCSLAQDFIQVHGHLVVSDSLLHFGFLVGGQNPHDSLGGKSVLGTLLVVSLWHIAEHDVGSLVDIVDDLAEVGLEVLGNKILEVGKVLCGDLSLPCEVSFAGIDQGSEAGILLHKLNEGLGNLEVCGGDGAFSTGWKSNGGLLVSFNGFSGCSGALTHVASKYYQVEVLVDVVHDL